MDGEAFEHHLLSPQGRGELPAAGFDGVAGGPACGDLVRVGLALDGERVAAIGFEASGCGATTAAASAAVALVRGQPLLEAARVGSTEIASELGGLSAGKHHAAELAADALARALGSAAAATAALTPCDDRVLVAMSGGVDSAVAALLCARDGAQVATVTLELWRDADNDGERSCCSADAVRLARSVAHSMGLPHLTLDLRDAFRAGVVAPFLAGYVAGETPNPCVRCNGSVRIDAMLELATRLGAPMLATGHYARISDDGDGPLLRAARDPAKDQTYALAGLAPDSLGRLRLPLGELTKPVVRELAADARLPVASRADSQDLCFLAGTSGPDFLARHGGVPEQPGEVVDDAGRVLGRHRGHHAYTVGQRRGLGVGGTGSPLYVLSKDAATNRIVVGAREALARSSVDVRDATLHRDARRVSAVRLRHHARAIPCRVMGSAAPGSHRRIGLELSEPAFAVAPGQVAVLQDGDAVIGHGTIA